MSSPSLTGFSPNNPLRYLGPNVGLTIVVTRTRAPTSADIKQPETGKYYSFGTLWLVGKNPTTGTFGDMYYLSKIVANESVWILLASSAAGEGPILTLTGNDAVVLSPDANGNVNVVGGAGIAFTGAGSTLTGNVTDWVSSTPSNFVPNVFGSVTGGTATYVTRQGVYGRIGNMVFVNINMSWSAHTGAGNMRIGGFPVRFNLGIVNYMLNLYTESIPLPTGAVDLFLNGTNNDTFATSVATITNAAPSPIALPSAGTIACTGFYFANPT